MPIFDASVRQTRNGIVHDPEIGNVLLEEVDFVASMRRLGGMFLEPA
jgi:hypothetical protein